MIGVSFFQPAPRRPHSPATTVLEPAMLRTRLSLLGPAVDARTQRVDSDNSSRTSSNTTNGTTSTLLSDSRTATFNREGAGNNSQIISGSIASIDYLTVIAIPEPGTSALLLGTISGIVTMIARRKLLGGTNRDFRAFL
ncbi:MAG: PEP-CTERM sorting domain-containing protein [Opitutaceae bacterium]|nr:PEP-CTERM sorting domain-containing protein [Opitutaceae bacterium]